MQSRWDKEAKSLVTLLWATGREAANQGRKEGSIQEGTKEGRTDTEKGRRLIMKVYRYTERKKLSQEVYRKAPKKGQYTGRKRIEITQRKTID